MAFNEYNSTKGFNPIAFILCNLASSGYCKSAMKDFYQQGGCWASTKESTIQHWASSPQRGITGVLSSKFPAIKAFFGVGVKGREGTE